MPDSAPLSAAKLVPKESEPLANPDDDGGDDSGSGAS